MLVYPKNHNIWLNTQTTSIKLMVSVCMHQKLKSFSLIKSEFVRKYLFYKPVSITKPTPFHQKLKRIQKDMESASFHKLFTTPYLPLILTWENQT